MWPFKRKQTNQPPVPSEVKDYYQAERRERVGVAWLLALATLVTTIVLAVGLFFGGRWVYRKVTKHDKPTTTVSTNKGTANQPTSGQTGSSGAQNTKPQTAAPDNPNGSSTSGTASSTSTPSPSTPASSQPQTSSALANTGPGDTIGIFVGVSTLAGFGHYIVTRRRTQNDKLW